MLLLLHSLEAVFSGILTCLSTSRSLGWSTSEPHPCLAGRSGSLGRQPQPEPTPPEWRELARGHLLQGQSLASRQGPERDSRAGALCSPRTPGALLLLPEARVMLLLNKAAKNSF